MHVNLDTGLYKFRFTGVPRFLLNQLTLLYDSGLVDSWNEPVDYTIDLLGSGLLRRLFRTQRVLSLDGQRIFNPVPVMKCLPSMEWAMNWCIGSFDHRHLLIHSAVAERDGKAILFPASQGSGKSTLSAFMGLKGWNLFSDELAIVDLESNTVNPIFRPASLKNKSIDIIKEAVPHSVFSNTTTGTQKGSVAHLKTSNFTQFQTFAPSKICAVVSPKYKANTQLAINKLNSMQLFALLVKNSFNYSVLGVSGFKTIEEIVRQSEGYSVNYSDFEQIIPFLSGLID
ncbi:HprK-related kinase A [Alteromonas sp. MB-3u-76]|jgi:HprK-related kinase A|uniref:HprK-related kinase A n=1 Tax=Alteromonas sp. MB-3u-76 TaxID=2058133 RepID=UPI000C302A25|nr:HprK-related kinase A [Alteromonas sp. MB-3u-76]AUC89096.1 HprK-related kinase A [Alteromonas sp. MB-3u-76]